MTAIFRIGVTRDFLKADGTLGFGDIGLDLLDESPRAEWEFLAENTAELRPDQIRGYDALLVLASIVSAETLQGADKLALVARFGVGYDSVDVAACNEQGVLLTITPDGVRRPVAVMALTYLLALSHKMLAKDRLVREGRWNERLDYMGMGVTGRTLGLVGLGNIGREICTLAKPFGIRCIAADPFVASAQAHATGAELVELDQLLQRADYVCICCALTEETHHLIGERELSLMKESAYLINAARGPIVNQQALTRALQRGQIAGAGLDVFETEPVSRDEPVLALTDQTIVAPHGLCWTDECFRLIGRSACRSILSVASGRLPEYTVNPQAAEHPRLKEKLNRYRAIG